MYRAILVDDEETVLRGLRNHVDWGKYDVSIAATFSDGQSAYDYVRENPVDLILTDVCMPEMDGIELSRKARALYPEMKILFVSAHSDVSFLRDALKLEAVDYILKSIDLDELDETLTRVVGRIDEERRQQQRFSELEAHMARSLPLIQNRRLTSLLRGTDEPEEMIEKEFRFLRLPVDSRTHYAVFVIGLRNKWALVSGMTEKECILFSLKIQNMLEEILNRYGGGVCVKDRIAEYILIANAEAEDYEETLLAVAENARDELRDTLALEVSIGISERLMGLRQIKDGYESACNAILRRYYIDGQQAISVNKYEEADGMKAVRAHAEKEIRDSLTAGDEAGLSEAVDRVLAEARALSPDEQQDFLIFLLMLPAPLLTNIDPPARGLYVSHRRLLERFLACENYVSQEALLREAFSEVARLLASLSAPQSNVLVRRVQELIEQKYMDHLSVNSLAQAVYLTPTYLCVLFKQYTGKTINEYITQERVRHAKRLLADPGILLYDVCYMVGYLSPSYFSRLFKKTAGMTPSEFREQAMLGERTARS